MEISNFRLTYKYMIPRGMFAILSVGMINILGNIHPLIAFIVPAIAVWYGFRGLEREVWGKAGWEKVRSFTKAAAKQQPKSLEKAPQNEVYLPPLSSLPPEKIMTLKEALPYLGISRQTFYNNPVYQRGFQKRGNSWVISVDELISVLTTM